jgi:hypothetical protein
VPCLLRVSVVRPTGFPVLDHIVELVGESEP